MPHRKSRRWGEWRAPQQRFQAILDMDVYMDSVLALRVHMTRFRLDSGAEKNLLKRTLVTEM